MLMYIATARAFLKRVPREVWYLVLAAALVWFVHHKGYNAGWDAYEAILRKEEAKAADKALKAAATATQEGIKRAETFDKQQEVLRDVIEEAEANGGNALDALF